MPQAPGVYTNDVTAPAGTDFGVDTAKAFIVIYSEKGPDDRAVWCTSLADVQTNFGNRLAVSVGYDACDAYFQLGGKGAWVSRNIVASTTAATVNLAGTSGTTLVGTARSKGTWGNSITVDITGASAPYTVTVKCPGYTTETSYPLTTRDDAVTWAANYSKILTFAAGGGTGIPSVVTGSALTGGTDSTSTDATTLATALARFDKQKGAGTVIAPGLTANVLHQAIVAHCADKPRTFALDLADSASAATQVGFAQALYSVSKIDRGVLCDPILVMPGGPLGSTREIPWSVVVAAHAAKSDTADQAPGTPLAGPINGAVLKDGSPIPGATLKRTRTDAERQQLDDAGVLTAITDVVNGTPGVPETYSDRTITPYYEPVLYTEYSDARTRMALQARAETALKLSVFTSLGGQGKAVAEATGRLRPLASDMWRDDVLDGDSYAAAYRTTVVADKANKKIKATLEADSAVSARTVEVNIVREYGS